MKNIKIEIKWALIFEKIEDHPFFTNFVAIPSIAIYIFALLDKKQNFYYGLMSYKQGFISGLIISVIVAILSPLSQYITTEFITPDYFSNEINYAVEQGEMTRDEAEGYFNLKSYILQSVIGALVMGLLTSAIVAIFVKSKSQS